MGPPLFTMGPTLGIGLAESSGLINAGICSSQAQLAVLAAMAAVLFLADQALARR